MVEKDPKESEIEIYNDTKPKKWTGMRLKPFHSLC